MFNMASRRWSFLSFFHQKKCEPLLGVSCAALNPNTFKCGKLGWEMVNMLNVCLQSQHGNDRCTARARLDTTCPVPTSPCMCGACARSVLLSFSPQVLFVAHQRSTPSHSIYSFSVVRGRVRQRTSRSGGPCQAWRPTATSPKP